MRLDMDCVRNILLELEDLPADCHTLYAFPKSIDKHGIDAVEYTLAKLKEGEYINADISLLPSGRYNILGIYNMTYDGHQFLESIRSPKVWAKITNSFNKVGSSSFSMAAHIATEVLTELAKDHFL